MTDPLTNDPVARIEAAEKSAMMPRLVVDLADLAAVLRAVRQARAQLDAVRELRANWAAWSGGRHDEHATWAEQQLATALAAGFTEEGQQHG